MAAERKDGDGSLHARGSAGAWNAAGAAARKGPGPAGAKVSRKPPAPSASTVAPESQRGWSGSPTSSRRMPGLVKPATVTFAAPGAEKARASPAARNVRG